MSLEFDLGEVKGRMSGIEKRMDNLEVQSRETSYKLDRVLDHVSETKGGWKVISLVVTASATIGAFSGKVLKFIISLIS